MSAKRKRIMGAFFLKSFDNAFTGFMSPPSNVCKYETILVCFFKNKTAPPQYKAVNRGLKCLILRGRCFLKTCCRRVPLLVFHYAQAFNILQSIFVLNQINAVR